MFAQRADKVCGQLAAFINEAANFADKPFFAFGLRFWFYVCLIIRVGHGFHTGEHPGFRDAADEHAMGPQIHILFHLEGDKGIHPLREIDQPIRRTEGLQAGKLDRKSVV